MEISEQGGFSAYPERVKSALFTLDHADLIRHIAYEDIEINDELMQEINELIIKGSEDIPAKQITTKQKMARDKAREDLARLLTWNDPNHSMYAAMKEFSLTRSTLATAMLSIKEFWENGIDPRLFFRYNPMALSRSGNYSKVVEGMQFFEDIGVNSSRIANGGMSRILFFSNVQTLWKRFGLMHRRANAAGWQGEVGEIISYEPNVLRMGKPKIGALARFTFDHALERPTPKALAKGALSPLESHIAMILEEDYRPERVYSYQSRIPPQERRNYILYRLNDPADARRLGQRCLLSYFAYKPLDEEEQLKYPNLAKSAKEGFREFGYRFEDYYDTESLLSDEDEWLQDVANVDDKWLEDANLWLRRGSIPMNASTPPYMVRKIEFARARFKELFQTKEGNKLERLFNDAQKKEGHLPVPVKVVQFCRDLISFGLDVSSIVCIPYSLDVSKGQVGGLVTLLKGADLDAVRIINTSPILLKIGREKIAARIEVFESNNISVDVINRCSKLLTYSEEWLDRGIQTIKDLEPEVYREIIELSPTILKSPLEELPQKVARAKKRLQAS